MTQQKQILSYNESGYNADSKQLEKAVQWFQGLFNEANNVGALQVQSMDDLEKIARSGSQAYRQLLIERTAQQEVAGIPMKPEGIVDSLDIDTSGIDAYLPDAKGYKPVWETKYLELNGNTVRIRKGALDELKERHTRYAKDEDEERLYEAQKKARDAIEELNEVAADVGTVQPLPESDPKSNLDMNHIGLYFRNIKGEVKTRTEAFERIKK